jgi:uncharacterized protein YbjT (DUF2867 family)
LRVTQGKVQSVVLQPTAFMDNLIAPWSLPALLDGTFANPAKADTRIAWISHRTLAEAVVAAATADVAGQTIEDIMHAEAIFLEKVNELHPDAAASAESD